MSSSGGAKAAKMKYVGCKLSQVKWRPQLPGCLECSDTLATGSKSHTENHVTFWRFPPPHEEMEGDTWLGEDGPTVMEPSLLCSVKTCSSVLALSFLDPVRIAASLCNGTVQLFTTHPSAASGREAQRWPGLHTGPCATLSSAASLIFTGGEDGRINVLKVGEEDPVRTIEQADSSIISALHYSDPTQQLISTNLLQQLKLWDLRSAGNTPAQTFSMGLSVDSPLVGLLCVSRHPSQPHLVATGCADGSLCFWDLRKGRGPHSIAKAHSSVVWDVQFHSSYPNNLFSCSEDGSLWHWDTSQAMDPSSSLSPWLSGAFVKGKVAATNYLPHNRRAVNSLDIESSHLVCVTDGGALVTVDNLSLK